MTHDLRALADRLERCERLGDDWPEDHVLAAALRSAADQLDAQEAELMRTWFVLKEFGYHPGRTDDKLADCVRAGLDAQKAEIETKQDFIESGDAEIVQLQAEIDRQWQPIETAPKDATAVLVMRNIWPELSDVIATECNEHNTYVAQWWSGENRGHGAWVCYMDAVHDPLCPIDPTHWMPLPKAPT